MYQIICAFVLSWLMLDLLLHIYVEMYLCYGLCFSS